MKIRKATIKDLDECVKISHIPEFSYMYSISDSKAKKYLRNYINKGILLVAEENNHVLGFISGEFMLGNFVWIDAITVKKEVRGRGVGKKLFKEFRKSCKQKGVKNLYLMSPKFNKNTIKFYESIGMKKGKEFIEFSEKLK
jgi:ribosomal protein S18 acetylase RimI-like enzyme